MRTALPLLAAAALALAACAASPPTAPRRARDHVPVLLPAYVGSAVHYRRAVDRVVAAFEADHAVLVSRVVVRIAGHEEAIHAQACLAAMGCDHRPIAGPRMIPAVRYPGGGLIPWTIGLFVERREPAAAIGGAPPGHDLVVVWCGSAGEVPALYHELCHAVFDRHGHHDRRWAVWDRRGDELAEAIALAAWAGRLP